MYPVKTPWWLSLISPRGLIWKGPECSVPTVYLTFDDGPHPTATPFVLKQLAAHNAQATFFCVGDCVERHPDIFAQVHEAGHTIGNHTQTHLNGWKVTSQAYLENIGQAAKLIPPGLFRPPYGRIKPGQAAALRKSETPWTVYMWSLLSGDFDQKITPEKCLSNVLQNILPRDIVVFHDSEKAWERLRYVLPFVLDYCKAKGWTVAALPVNR